MIELVLCRFRSANTGRIYQQYVRDGVEAWNLRQHLLHDDFITSSDDFMWTVVEVKSEEAQALLDGRFTEVSWR